MEYGRLVTIAPDFTCFLQMIMNYGELDNERIITRKFVELMISNQVNGIQDKSILCGNFGYGLSVGVSYKVNNGPTKGITWTEGPYNTSCAIDFESGIYAVFLTQTGPWGHHGIMWTFGDLAKQTLIE